MDLTTELTAVLSRLMDEHNVMWDLGDIPAGSRIRDIHPDLVAVQYSPKFDGACGGPNQGRSGWRALRRRPEISASRDVAGSCPA